MAFNRAPVTDSPEFDDLPPEPGDGILISLLMPVVWLHAFVTGPFKYRGRSMASRTIGWRPLPSEQAKALPVPVLQFANRVEDALAPLGFPEPVRHGNFSRPNGEGQSTLIVAPSESGEDCCLASFSYVPRRFTMWGVTFQTRMTDGRLVATGNERRVVPGPRANHDVVTFADVDNVAELYDIHRRRKARAMKGGGVPELVGWRKPSTHPLEVFQRLFDQGVEDGIRRGTVVPPATEDVRLTLKGAAFAAWGTIGPVERFLDWREARRAARERRALGF